MNLSEKLAVLVQRQGGLGALISATRKELDLDMRFHINALYVVRLRLKQNKRSSDPYLISFIPPITSLPESETAVGSYWFVADTAREGVSYLDAIECAKAEEIAKESATFYDKVLCCFAWDYKKNALRTAQVIATWINSERERRKIFNDRVNVYLMMEEDGAAFGTDVVESSEEQSVDPSETEERF